jgi:NAD(P)-dependent dehydrogenase (short-subunit alcohol dehydrogenase family)
VNNAGVNFAKPFLETTAEEWQSVISVDLRAVFFLSQVFNLRRHLVHFAWSIATENGPPSQLVCKHMVAQRPASGGSIVNISSVHALAGVPGAGPYDAAKSGGVSHGR